jgi:tetratricopeptide (TPR) repeat protein
MRNADATEDARVEASLKKAIALNPRFAPAYDLLAQFYDIHREHTREAHMLEAQAISLEPDNVQYRLDAAAGLANHQDFDNALRVLDAARHVARNHAAMAMIDLETGRIRAVQAMMERAQRENSGPAGGGDAKESAGRAPYRGLMQRVPSRAVVTKRQGSGPELNLVTKAPDYPSGPPAGAKQMVMGVVTQASCYYPAMLVLTVDAGGKTLTLYRDNYFHVRYSAVGVTIHGDLHPCTDLVGKRARIGYAEVKDAKAAGQILAVELLK